MLYKVLLADYQQLALEGLKQILSGDSSFQIMDEVHTFNELETKIQQHQPHILMLDYENLHGFSIHHYQHLIEKYPALQVLIITANHDRDQILKYLEPGPPGFLTKDCSKAEILGAFRALAKGQKFYCNRVLDLLVENTFKRKSPDAAYELLNEREIQIIYEIAEGLSTHEMADKMCLSPHTINAYRKSILKKLEAKTPVEMIVKAFRLRILQLS